MQLSAFSIGFIKFLHAHNVTFYLTIVRWNGVPGVRLAGNIFCIPGFENVSPGDRSAWVKETHCCGRGMEILVLNFLLFIINYVC